MFCLAEEVISAAAAAAEQKNDDNYPTASTIITATASATVTATATATEAAAAATEAQDNDQPDNIEAASIPPSHPHPQLVAGRTLILVPPNNLFTM